MNTVLSADFVGTYHVVGELSAEVVSASAFNPVDHFDHHLFEFARPWPQVVQRPPACRLHRRARVGVCASRSQQFDGPDGIRGVEWSVQLWKYHKTFMRFYLTWWD